MSSNTPTPPGNFSYPPRGSKLQFNFIDSVVTSWVVFDSNPTRCRLSIWYWPNTDPWRIGFNESAPANGTEIVPLDFTDNSGSYLGQLNFKYIASDGSPQRFLSPIFNVDTSPQSKAVTWSQAVLALPTSSVSATLQTSIPASFVTSSASPATITTSSNSALVSNPSASVSNLPASVSNLPASVSNLPESVSNPPAISSSISVSKPSSTSGSGLGKGAIAGIIVGVVFCVGLAAALIFYRLRKPNSVQAEVKAPSPTPNQTPIPAGFLGEKHGAPVKLNELLGDGHLWEMATSNH